MRQAWELASRVWPAYSHKCSRHDFTLPQLFACRVIREMLKLSYRKTETLVRDAQDWRHDIGLSKASPDHNTLWRAFGVLLKTHKVNRMLDLMTQLFAHARLLGLSIKPLTIDSTCYQRRHRSRHYDRVYRKMRLREGAKYTEKPAPTKVETGQHQGRHCRRRLRFGKEPSPGAAGHERDPLGGLLRVALGG